MATKLTRIQRLVAAGKLVFSDHCLDELSADKFTRDDAKNAILKAGNSEEQSDGRFNKVTVIYGNAKDGRAMKVIVAVRGQMVYAVTAYEHFA